MENNNDNNSLESCNVKESKNKVLKHFIFLDQHHKFS